MSDRRQSSAVATPLLAVRNAADAMDWYIEAFGAVELGRLAAPDGTIAHGELAIEGATIMIAEESDLSPSPETLGGSPVAVHLDVDEVDALFERAVKAGAGVVIPLADQFYGARAGRIMDPFGHLWILSKHIRDIPLEELQRYLSGGGGAQQK